MPVNAPLLASPTTFDSPALQLFLHAMPPHAPGGTLIGKLAERAISAHRLAADDLSDPVAVGVAIAADHEISEVIGTLIVSLELAGFEPGAIRSLIERLVKPLDDRIAHTHWVAAVAAIHAAGIKPFTRVLGRFAKNGDNIYEETPDQLPLWEARHDARAMMGFIMCMTSIDAMVQLVAENLKDKIDPAMFTMFNKYLRDLLALLWTRDNVAITPARPKFGISVTAEMLDKIILNVFGLVIMEGGQVAVATDAD